MKILRLGIVTLLFFTTLLADAQSKKYKVDGKKCVRMELMDAGEFYSTFTIDAAEIETLKAQKVKPILMDHIINNHTEDKWPSELANLDTRFNYPEKVNSYVVFKVAKLNDKYILVVPARFNNDNGEGWASTNDIFFVVGEKGVK